MCGLCPAADLSHAYFCTAGPANLTIQNPITPVLPPQGCRLTWVKWTCENIPDNPPWPSAGSGVSPALVHVWCFDKNQWYSHLVARSRSLMNMVDAKLWFLLCSCSFSENSGHRSHKTGLYICGKWIKLWGVWEFDFDLFLFFKLAACFRSAQLAFLKAAEGFQWLLRGIFL